MGNKLTVVYVTDSTLYNEVQKTTSEFTTISGEDLIGGCCPFYNLLVVPDFLIKDTAEHLVDYFNMIGDDEDITAYVSNGLVIDALRLQIAKDRLDYNKFAIRMGEDEDKEDADILVNTYGTFTTNVPKSYIFYGMDICTSTLKIAMNKRKEERNQC